MEDVAKLQVLVPALAFGRAVVFGAVAQRVNFCTMGAVTDVANFGDWLRMRMWLLAIATGIAGTALLTSSGLMDIGKTFYTTAQVPWLSNLVGGFLFGFGMTLSSGCGSNRRSSRARRQCRTSRAATCPSTASGARSGTRPALAIGSILAFLAIVGGCLAAVRYQIWRIEATA